MTKKMNIPWKQLKLTPVLRIKKMLHSFRKKEKEKEKERKRKGKKVIKYQERFDFDDKIRILLILPENIETLIFRPQDK